MEKGLNKDTDNSQQPNGDYKFAENVRRAVIHNTPFNGEIGIVTLPVKVLFEWSDKIIVDNDSETGEVLKYTTGYIMKIMPETIAYNKQDIIHFSSAVPDNKIPTSNG